MTRAHEIPDAIVWHEGLLLAPQHFQQQALRTERLIRYHANLSTPFRYGVLAHQIDQSQLAQGLVRFRELEAVMPDGLVVSAQTEGPHALELDIKDRAELARQQDVLIYLVVPSERLTDGQAQGALSRYASTPGEAVHDLHTGGRPVQIPRLRARLRLVAGEPPAGYCSLPVLAVRYQDGAFAAADYIAPLLQVTQDTPLAHFCDSVGRRVREKSLYLSEMSRSPAVAGNTALFLENQRMVTQLVGGLLPLEGLLRTFCAHPFDLYLAMLELASQVAAVGPSPVPPVFAGYNHTDLRRSFAAVASYILDSIAKGIPDTFTRVHLQASDGIFSVWLEREWLAHPLTLELRGQSERELAAFARQALIVSKSQLDAVRDRRGLGVRRRPIDSYQGLFAGPDRLLYALDPADVADELLADEPLIIANLPEPKSAAVPTAIFLLVGNQT